MLAEEKRIMVEAFTKYFDDQISVTKEQIDQQKKEKEMIEKAERQSASLWKKDIRNKESKKMNQLLSRLDQEDERYLVENLDYDKMEQKLISMYKRI